MATHDDTIVLDASPVTTGPRVKRVKTEHSTHSPTAAFENHHNALWTPSAQTPSTAESSLPPTATANHHHGRERSREASSKVSSPPPEAAPEGPVLRKIKTPSLRLRLAQASQPKSQSPRPASTPKPRLIDFTAAPTDPTDFVWWLVHQLSVAPSSHTLNGTELLPGFDSMTSIMRPLNLLPHGLEDDPNIAKEKEREKQRVDNRERKKRWRETNAERNKDNDLRCRVTKLAKAKFGSEDSPGKAAFIEREFEIRRAKRAEKEKRNASYRGTLSAFRTGSSSSKDLKDTLRLTLKGNSKPDIENIGSQLVDILVDAAGQQLSESAVRAAQALRDNIRSGAAALADVDEATRILAGNEELRRALETGIEDGKDSAEPDSIGDDEEEPIHGNGHWTKDTTPANHFDLLDDGFAEAKPRDPAGNLNLAVQTLNGMSQPKPPRPSGRSSRGRATRVRKGKRPQRQTAEKPSMVSHVLETSSIDALLALANGGSIMNNDDDDDDETIPDPDELIAEDLNFLDATADTQLNVILERVATRIVTERLEREGFKRRNGSALTFDADAFRTHAVREQVLRLKTFLSEAGVSVNTLMPLAQAQALSELYAHLLKYIERESTPPHETPPRAVAVNGAPSASKVLGRLERTKIAPLEASTKSHRTADEQRKIITYGFPPLPGGIFAGLGGKAKLKSG